MKTLRMTLVGVVALYAAVTAAARAGEERVINGCVIRPAALCAGINLQNAKLAGAEFARADLSRADLSGADLRNVTVFAEGEIDRSPCGTGTCAVLAVLDAMGIVAEGQPFIHESIVGSTFSARVMSRTTVGELPAIVPELTGSAWITGITQVLIDPSDPFPEGYLLADTWGVSGVSEWTQ